MTQEQQKQTEVIAEYDGWVKQEDKISSKSYAYKSHVTTEWHYLLYHKNDDWIMPVARKVWRELTNAEMQLVSDKIDAIDNIKEFQRINNDIVKLRLIIPDMQLAFTKSTSDLFESVYHAIIFLNTINKAK